jgi:hypothetical protein
MVEDRKLLCWDKIVNMLSGEVKSLRRVFLGGDEGLTL